MYKLSSNALHGLLAQLYDPKSHTWMAPASLIPAGNTEGESRSCSIRHTIYQLLFSWERKFIMHLLTELNSSLFVNNEKKKYCFALRNRPRKEQKGGSEAGNGKREVWAYFRHWNMLPWEGGELPQCSLLHLWEITSILFISLSLNLGSKDWNLGLRGRVGGITGTNFHGQPSLPLTNHSGCLNTVVQITKISDSIIILDKLKMLLSPLEQPENRTNHWLNFNGTIKEQLIPQHGVPSVGNYRVRNAPSPCWPDWCKVPWRFAMFVKLAIVCFRIYPISQK